MDPVASEGKAVPESQTEREEIVTGNKQNNLQLSLIFTA